MSELESKYASISLPDSTDTVFDVLQKSVFDLVRSFESFRMTKWSSNQDLKSIDLANVALLNMCGSAGEISTIAVKLHEAYAQFEEVITGWGQPRELSDNSTEDLATEAEPIALPGDELSEDPFAEFP